MGGPRPGERSYRERSGRHYGFDLGDVEMVRNLGPLGFGTGVASRFGIAGRQIAWA
jgi:hypothetical protein